MEKPPFQGGFGLFVRIIGFSVWRVGPAGFEWTVRNPE